MTTAALGDVADFINGFAFKPGDWQEDGLPIVRIQNLTDATKPVNRTTRVVPDKFRVRKGELLVSWSATLGVFTWNRTEEALVNQHIFRVVPSDKVEQPFLRHMLSGALDSMQRHLHGATMQHVNRGEFLSTKIPLPPLPEQRRIAEILDHADALRAKRRQALTHLSSLTQSVFDSMFGDDLPMAPLGELAETRLGKMLDAKKQTGEHRRPYLRNANVQWFRFELEDLLEMDFTEKDRATLALLPGDVLVCEGGQPGRSAIWRGVLDECYFQKALHRVRLGDDLEPEYFTRAMKKIVDTNARLKDYVTSSTIAHLSWEKLEKLRTLPIPVRICRARVRESRKDASAGRILLRTNKATNELFSSLQSRAFRGEL